MIAPRYLGTVSMVAQSDIHEKSFQDRQLTFPSVMQKLVSGTNKGLRRIRAQFKDLWKLIVTTALKCIKLLTELTLHCSDQSEQRWCLLNQSNPQWKPLTLRLPRLTCFLALVTGYKFPAQNQRLQVFPRFPQDLQMFSRAWFCFEFVPLWQVLRPFWICGCL